MAVRAGAGTVIGMNSKPSPTADPLAAAVIIHEAAVLAIAAYGSAPIGDDGAYDALYVSALDDCRVALLSGLRRNEQAHTNFVAAASQAGDLAKTLAQATLAQYAAVLSPGGAFPAPDAGVTPPA